MARIAILGFGTVGGGVFDVLNESGVIIARNAEEEVSVKRIFDIHEITRPDAAALLTRDFNEILGDEEISVVVECIGGVCPAYEYTKRALTAGKSVCTSNKELVSTHGAELVGLAVRNGVNYMYEGAVAGGIPIIRAIHRCITGDTILGVSGILNGTTNYIMTEMSRRGKTYEEAVESAQRHGYAERDPSFDVNGIDAGFKLSILLSLITGRRVRHENIYTEGIGGITAGHIKAAKDNGYLIKSVANGTVYADGRVSAYVVPMMVGIDNPLYAVNGVYNAVTVTGAASGDLMFYGRGAGKRPTASAVIADVIDSVKHYGRKTASVSRGWTNDEAAVKPFDDKQFKKLNGVRVLA